MVRKLTHLELDFTHTNYQIGLALKSIFAQLTNSTLIPLLVSLYIKDNIYDANGLVYDVFYLGISNALLPPILKLVDLEHWGRKLLAWFKSWPCTGGNRQTTGSG